MKPDDDGETNKICVSHSPAATLLFLGILIFYSLYKMECAGCGYNFVQVTTEPKESSSLFFSPSFRPSLPSFLPMFLPLFMSSFHLLYNLLSTMSTVCVHIVEDLALGAGNLSEVTLLKNNDTLCPSNHQRRASQITRGLMRTSCTHARKCTGLILRHSSVINLCSYEFVCAIVMSSPAYTILTNLFKIHFMIPEMDK